MGKMFKYLLLKLLCQLGPNLDKMVLRWSPLRIDLMTLSATQCGRHQPT